MTFISSRTFQAMLLMAGSFLTTPVSVSAAGLKEGITETIQIGRTDIIQTLRDDGTPNVGDVFTWVRGNKIYNTDTPSELVNAEVIGDNQGHCIRLTNEGDNSQWDCDLTLFFPDGQIHAHGPFHTGVTDCVITGGTGAYEGATGFFELSFAGSHNDDLSVNPDGTLFSYNYVFHLKLCNDEDKKTDVKPRMSGGGRTLGECDISSVKSAVQLALLGSMAWW